MSKSTIQFNFHILLRYNMHSKGRKSRMGSSLCTPNRLQVTHREPPSSPSHKQGASTRPGHSLDLPQVGFAHS